jgi:hypothetical protein
MKKIRLYVLMACFLLPFAVNSQAPFRSGNFVVVRLGDGNPPSGTRSMFLDEYTTAGTLVQSVALPTTNNGSNLGMSLVANRGYLGFLTLSPNKQFLALMGYATPPGTSTADINNNPASINRAIARIDFNGIVNSSTSILGTDVALDASNAEPASAITDDGTRFWVTLINSSFNGIRYVQLGQSASSFIYGGAVATSTLNIDNGQLYVSSNNNGNSMALAVSGGLPTNGPQTATALPGIPNSVAQSSQFFFADLNPSIPGSDVIYVADASNYALSKFSYNQATASWVLNGTIGIDEDDYRGITGAINGGSVTLYCTKGFPDLGSSPGGQIVTLTDNTGYTLTANSFTGTPTVIIPAPGANTVFRGIAMVPQPLSVSLSTKVFLQGAYNSGLGRHKDVTPTWATTLNTDALTQPYNVAPFNYAGTESVSNGFFTSTGATTDIVDWVLLELRDATTPSTVVARQAAFIREDGKIVGLDGVSDPSFTGVGANNYYIVLRHRNHLAIRSSSTVFVNGAAPVLYDFTTAQAQAYQNPSVLTNAAMKNFTGVFCMWSGNANMNNNVRYTGLNNDAAALLAALGGNQAAVLNDFHPADINADGSVRYTGLNNDAAALLSALSGNQAAVLTEHQ